MSVDLWFGFGSTKLNTHASGRISQTPVTTQAMHGSR